jgi:hypothetical protein
LQVAGEVLSVVSEQSVEEAQKNAARNKISNCQYFDGSPEEVLPQIARKIIFEKACVVIICGAGRNTTCKYWGMLDWCIGTIVSGEPAAFAGGFL